MRRVSDVGAHRAEISSASRAARRIRDHGCGIHALSGTITEGAALIQRAQDRLAEGDHRRALGALQGAIGSDSSHATAHEVDRLAARLDPKKAGLLPVRVAFLSDHLQGPLPSLVRAQALLSGLLVDPYVADFDVWRQELANASSKLYEQGADVVAIDLILERLAPRLASEFLAMDRSEIEDLISRTVGVVMGSIDALRTRLDCRVLVHAFAIPTVVPLGLMDRLSEHGQADAIRELNAALRRTARERPNTYVVSTDDLAASLGGRAFFDRRMYAFAKLPYSGQALTALALEYNKYLRAFFGRAKKVLVLDADNTLWGGVVGEDGVDGIKLDADSRARGYLDFQRYVAELGRRGVILVLNSSNERSDVLEVFETRGEMILKPTDFALIVANWNDKADNLVEIARELELGTDSFVYVDDDAHQCARVREAMPEVAVVQVPPDPFDAVDALARFGWFDSLSLTDEDRRRNAMYQSNVVRNELERKAAGSIEEFLRSLQARLVVERIGPTTTGTIGRASSLTQRTNQFNLTTRRYSEDDIRARANDPGWLAFTAKLDDRLGDFGIIGLAMVELRGAEADIDTFLISCRALRRNVEDAMLAIAVEWALGHGARRVVGTYCPTAKNAQTADFFPAHGFTPIGPSDTGSRRWERTTPLPMPTGLDLVREGVGW